MYSLRDLKINPNDLVSVQMTVNSSQLYSVLQTAIDTINSQARTLNSLELKFTSLLQKVEEQEEQIQKVMTIANLVTNDGEAIESDFRQLKNQTDRLEHELLLFKKQEQAKHLENELVRDKLRTLIEDVKKVQSEDQAHTKQQEQLIKILEDKIYLQSETIQSKLMMFNESTVPEIADSVKKECLAFIETSTTEIKTDLSVVQEKCVLQDTKIQKHQRSIETLQDQLPRVKQTLQESFENFRQDAVTQLQDHESEISQNKKGLHAIFKIFSIDSSVITYASSSVSDEPINQSDFQSSRPPASPQTTSARKSPTQASPSTPSTLAPPTTTTKAGTLSRSPSGSLLNSTSRTVSPINTSYNQERAPTALHEQQAIFANILLKTPAFVKLKTEFNNSIAAVEEKAKSIATNYRDGIFENFMQVDKELEERVTRSELKKVMENWDVVKETQAMTKKHHESLEYIFAHYLSRDQTWEALRSKADTKTVDLKADRKYVTSLFDYINEKLNAVLGENDGANEKVMQALKHIEGEIQQLSESTKAKAKEAALAPPPQQLPMKSSSAPVGVHPRIAKQIVDGDLVTEDDLPVAARYRCLSCNRPVGSSYDKKDSFGAVMPPTTIPNISSKPSLKGVDPQARLGSYYSWLHGDAETAQKLLGTSDKDQADTLAGGFSTAPASEKGSERRSVAFSEPKTLQDVARETPNLSQDLKPAILNLAKIDKSQIPLPPKSAPSSGRKKKEVEITAPKSARESQTRSSAEDGSVATIKLPSLDEKK